MLYLIIFISVLKLVNSQPTPSICPIGGICNSLDQNQCDDNFDCLIECMSNNVDPVERCFGGPLDGKPCADNPGCGSRCICNPLSSTTTTSSNAQITDDVNMLIGISAAALAFSVCACLIVCMGCFWWGYSKGLFPMEV